MKEITKISRQKRSAKRFNVFLNNEYAFSVSEDTYVKYHLHKGKQLSNEEINEIQYDDSIQGAYILSINYLSYRMRTEKEVRLHLIKKEIEAVVIEKVITRLYEEKLLNDLLFAESFVKDRINRSSKGPQVIYKELEEKGLSKSDIEQALQIYTKEIEFDKAFKWGQKEINKKSNKPLRGRKEQLKNKLLRRGFSKDILFEVVDMVQIEKDDEEEFQLLKKEADKLYNKYKKKYSESELKQRMKQGLYSRGFALDAIDKYIEILLNKED